MALSAANGPLLALTNGRRRVPLLNRHDSRGRRRADREARRSAQVLRTVAECCRLTDDAISATGSRLMTAVQDTLSLGDLAETPTASDWCQRWNGRRHSLPSRR